MNCDITLLPQTQCSHCTGSQDRVRPDVHWSETVEFGTVAEKLSDRSNNDGPGEVDDSFLGLLAEDVYDRSKALRFKAPRR